MADLEKTVAVLFKGVDEISGTMNSISGSLSTFGGKLESATQPLANMAMAIEKADAALAVLAIGGMVVATSAAGTFQAGMNEIHTLLRESPEVVAAFDKSIEDYARNSTQSLEDIQKAIYQSLSANVSYGESVEFVSNAEKLAVAGKSTLTEAVDLLTSTLTAYGAGWDQASKYSDVFFKTVEIGKVTIPELSQSLSLVAPIAATAGVSIEEVGAALAAMTAGGLAAGPSAEYLRHAISDLIDPAANAKGMFDELGISYGGAELSAHGLSGKMAEIWEKTNGNIDVISKLFSNVTSMTAAMTLGKDSSGYYAKALEELANSAGSTDRAYGIMVDNFDKINQRLVNSMKLALIDSGKPLLDDWKELALGLGEVFKGIDIGLKAGAFDEIYAAIQAFSDDFAGYLKDIAKAMPEAMAMVDFDPFIQSIKDLGNSAGEIFKAMFGEVDLTTPEGLAASMQKVVDGVTMLMKVSQGIAESLQPFAEQLGKVMSSAEDADGSTVKLVGNILGLGQGINAVVSALNAVAPALAIFSGALIIEAITTVGKLGITLAAASGPVGWAILAAAAIAGVSLAVIKLGEDSEKGKESFKQFQDLFGADPAKAKAAINDVDDKVKGLIKTLMDVALNWDGLFTPGKSKDQIDKIGKAISDMGTTIPPIAGELSRMFNDLPEVKTFTINAETGAATEKINALNTSVLSFPADFKVEAQVDLGETTYGALLTKLNDIPKEYSILYKADMDEPSISVISSITDIPELKKLSLAVELENEAETNKFMSDISQTYPINAWVNLDQDSFQKTKDKMTEIINPDGTKTWVNVGVDEESMKRTKAALTELPTEKMLEIKLQGEIDKDLETIKSGAATVQSAMEWTAKVNIAGIEGETERITAMFSTVSDTIDSVSGEIGQLFSKIPKSEFDFGAREWKKAMEQAMDIQQKSFNLEKSLIETQIDFMKKKESMMLAGKGLIKIDSTGLEPALEMIMWQILQKVQMRASEEHAQFLLGVGSP